MKSVLQNLLQLVRLVKNRLISLFRFIGHRTETHPLISFFSVLAILFFLIIVGNTLRKPKAEEKIQPVPKSVETYHIGTAPKLTVQGQVEKAGVVQVNALMAGVVQKITVYEGKKVYKGQTLAWFSSNYQGGNTLTLARQIAEKQNKNVEDTYQVQKDVIQKQRDIANQSQSNFESLRDITAQSMNDTKALIDLNNSIIASYSNSINALPPDSSSTASLKQVMSQFMSANLQLNAASRSAQYQTDTSKPPTVLAQTQRDIALKQLDIQEKSLNLGKELSGLQLQVARVAEAMMYPAAPFTASIEHVFVREGQYITAGTPLFTITAINDPPLDVYVYTTKEIAQKVSRIEPSIIHIGDRILSLTPSFISSEAITGNLFTVMYTIPQDEYANLTDKGYVVVDMPLGSADSEATIPYIPLDAVYQTQDKAYVFVLEQGKALSRIIEIGPVQGDFVQVNKGISSGDAIILDRTVLNDDAVQAIQ